MEENKLTSNPFSFFDKIYCISMSEKSLNWTQAKKQLKILGIYERTERIQAIKEEKYWEGCRKSHQLCVRDAKKSGAKSILILEDDFVFMSRDMKLLGSTLNNLKKYDWELFYLGAIVEKKLKDLEDNLCSAKVWATHAYAINHKVFDKILTFKGDERILPNGCPAGHIDVFYYENDFKTYLINPIMVLQMTPKKKERMHVQVRSFWKEMI